MDPLTRRELREGYAVRDHGSIVLLIPLSLRVDRWLREHVLEGTYFGPGLVVEPRYLPDLVEALRRETGS
jgi:hypothetical protein